jgi:hypothetical protein
MNGTLTPSAARSSQKSICSGIDISTAYYVAVKGTRHFNYSDFSLFSPDNQKAGILGSIDGARMERIMNDYVLACFDKYLRGKDSPLLKAPWAKYAGRIRFTRKLREEREVANDRDRS